MIESSLGAPSWVDGLFIYNMAALFVVGAVGLIRVGLRILLRSPTVKKWIKCLLGLTLAGILAMAAARTVAAEEKQTWSVRRMCVERATGNQGVSEGVRATVDFGVIGRFVLMLAGLVIGLLLMWKKQIRMGTLVMGGATFFSALWYLATR